MQNWKFSLSLKLVVCLIGSMIIIFTILGYQQVRLHRKDLEEMTLLSADRISAIGYGSEKPVASNTSSEGRAKNRRIDIIIMK